MTGPEGPQALRIFNRTELDGAAAARPASVYDCNPITAEVYDFDALTEGVSRIVCVRDYGGGVLEAGFSSVRSARLDVESEPREDDPEVEISAEARARLDAANLDRSVRRSKAQVRRKCMAGGLDHLLTLTYRENMQDSKKGWRDCKLFLRHIRAHLGEFSYVAVMEYQQRGAVHVHLAVRGFQNVRLLRTLWRDVIGEGNIDVQAPRKAGSAKWQLAKLAGYISKYITKSVAGLTGRQRYRVSQDIEIPSRTFVYIVRRGVDMVRELFEGLGVSVGFHWEPEGSPHGWACSWS